MFFDEKGYVILAKARMAIDKSADPKKAKNNRSAKSRAGHDNTKMKNANPLEQVASGE